MAKASSVPADVERSIKALTDERSLPYDDKRKIEELPQRGTVVRLIRLVRIGMPKVRVSAGRTVHRTVLSHSPYC